MIPPARTRPGLSLAVLLCALFIANVDTAIANIAAPAIRADLRLSGGALELAVSGYVLAFAMLLITGARLGGTYGHRRIFAIGVAGFTAASLACALAPNGGTLVVARMAQGAAAALMVPQVLTGIQLTFTGRARARALGYFAMTLAGGAVAGQVLGGVLVSADLFGTGWRPVFFINVPVGAALLAAALRYLPDRRRGRSRLDLPGVAVLSAAILLVVLPLVLGPEHGWPGWTWPSLAAGAAGLAGFAAVERRVAARGGRPLLDLAVLGRPRIVWGLLAHGAATATYQTLLFVLALYLQQGLGRGPLYSGLALVSWVAAFGVAGPLLPRVPDRLRPYVPITGYVILGAAYALICGTALSPLAGGPALVAALGVGGFGLGVGFSSMVAHVTDAVGPRHAPDISGVANTVAQTSGVIGVASFGTLYVALAATAGGPRAFAVVMAGLVAVAALAAFAGRRATRTAAVPDAAVADVPVPSPAAREA